MVMVRIGLSFLSLFLSATYVVAAGRAGLPAVSTPESGNENLEAFCKKTHDINSCIELLKPAVTPTTQFDSLEWHRKVLSKSLSKAIVAKAFMSKHGRGLDPRQQSAVTNCVDKIDDSVELLQQVSHEYLELYKSESSRGFLYGYHRKNVQGLMNAATADQEACHASLQGAQEPSMQQMMDFVNKASIANKIVSELILKKIGV